MVAGNVVDNISHFKNLKFKCIYGNGSEKLEQSKGKEVRPEWINRSFLYHT